MRSPLDRPILSGAVLLAFLVLVGLGTWQVQRLQWKNHLIATVEARLRAEPVAVTEVMGTPLDDIRYRPVSLSGQWMPLPAVHVVGTHDGTPGYYVFQPLDLQGEEEVMLVDLGFVPDGDQAMPRRYELPKGNITLTGLVREFDREEGFVAAMAAPDDIPGGLLYLRRHSAFSEAFDTSLFDGFYIDARETVILDGPVQAGTTRVEFSNRHLGYAITWFGLAAGLVGVYAVMMHRTTDQGQRH